MKPATKCRRPLIFLPKRSRQADARPHLIEGELAVNFATRRMFIGAPTENDPTHIVEVMDLQQLIDHYERADARLRAEAANTHYKWWEDGGVIGLAGAIIVLLLALEPLVRWLVTGHWFGACK